MEGAQHREQPADQKNVRRVYADYAASTPVDARVLEAMQPYWSEYFGNASGIHTEAMEARTVIEESRAVVASIVGIKPEGLTFTSGGTEANNLAILGVAKALNKSGRPYESMHVITSDIEHSSVTDCFEELRELGARVSFVGVDESGVIDPERVREMLMPDTVLVSLMLVNSEIGTIAPLKKIARVLAEHRSRNPEAMCFFHTDASQAAAYVSVNLETHGVDMMTLDAQKMYGPKGVGALARRLQVPIAPVIIGGGQERGVRPGTPNTPLIVGFGAAFAFIEKERDALNEQLTPLRDLLIEKILEKVPNAELNGSHHGRVSNNVNISIPGIESEFVLLQLDAKGIACSTKSPCKGSGGGSHVIRALGKTDAHALASLRFSIGRDTQEKDIDTIVTALKECVEADTQ